MLQFFLGSAGGSSSTSVETTDVAGIVVDATASGTGTAFIAPDVATVAATVADATAVLSPVVVAVDAATVSSSVSDAASNELIIVVDVAQVGLVAIDPVVQMWPTTNQRNQLTRDQLYERIHVGETRMRRQSPDDAQRPLRPQEAV